MQTSLIYLQMSPKPNDTDMYSIFWILLFNPCVKKYLSRRVYNRLIQDVWLTWLPPSCWEWPLSETPCPGLHCWGSNARPPVGRCKSSHAGRTSPSPGHSSSTPHRCDQAQDALLAKLAGHWAQAQLETEGDVSQWQSGTTATLNSLAPCPIIYIRQ
jgi:hypothetical protein